MNARLFIPRFALFRPMAFTALALAALTLATFPGRTQDDATGTGTAPESMSLERVGAWCNAKNLRFSYSDDKSQIVIPEVGRNKLRVIAMFDGQREMLMWLIPVVSEPKAEWQVLARAANRINIGISSGAFVAREDGVVLYRMGVPTRGAAIDADGIGYHFDLAIGTVNTLFEALQQVNAGTLEPEDVFSAAQ